MSSVELDLYYSAYKSCTTSSNLGFGSMISRIHYLLLPPQIITCPVCAVCSAGWKHGTRSVLLCRNDKQPMGGEKPVRSKRPPLDCREIVKLSPVSPKGDVPLP